MRFFRDDESGGLKIREHRLARRVAIEPAVLRRCVVVERRVEIEDRQHLQLMTLADEPIVEIVRRSDLHDAGAEFSIDVAIRNYRNVASGERKPYALADIRAVTLVVGMHGNGGIAEHRFGARRRDDERA